MSGLSDAAVRRLQAAARWPEFHTDRYTVAEEIGRGGMGTVYAATDGALEREVAIKVSNGVASAGVERRLAAEARVLARLEHPGIVPVHDVGRLVDGRLFYVMTRVHGRTLAEHLQHDVDLGERLRIFERICEAVAFAHARRILHRDLKPDNVMIGAFGEVMVMDWGVAKMLGQAPGVPGDPIPVPAAVEGETPRPSDARATSPGTVVGTRGYMAPEQARGDTDAIDERTDVYGLGAILLVLLVGAGAAAGVGASPVAALAAARANPRPLRSICARALAPDPADRYPSAEALRADIARFRAGRAVLAHRETAVERVTRLARVYRMPLLLVLAYVVMRTIVAFTIGR